MNNFRLAWFNYLLYITTWVKKKKFGKKIFISIKVGENIYGGNPNAPEGSEAKKLFDVNKIKKKI
jgi:hypothetical protein